MREALSLKINPVHITGPSKHVKVGHDRPANVGSMVAQARLYAAFGPKF